MTDKHEMTMKPIAVLCLVVRMSILDTKVAGSNLSINMFSP